MIETVTRRGVLAGGLSLAMSAAAWGQQRQGGVVGGDPFALQTEYNAEAIFGTGAQARPGRFGRIRNAIRQEIDTGGGVHTVIVRLDQSVAWTMVPGVRVVVESDLRGLNLPMAALTGNGNGGLRKVAGPRETIDGVGTTRYRIETVPPTHAEFAGDVWSTPRGVVMKIVGMGAYNGRRTDLSASFRNVREAPQDQSLYQLPGGYRLVQVPLDNLQQMLDSFSRFNLQR